MMHHNLTNHSPIDEHLSAFQDPVFWNYFRRQEEKSQEIQSF